MVQIWTMERSNGKQVYSCIRYFVLIGIRKTAWLFKSDVITRIALASTALGLTALASNELDKSQCIGCRINSGNNF